MDLSIVIVNFNTKNITKKCLDTVFESFKNNSNIKFEVIVFDNGSNDGSKTLLKKYPEIKFIDNHKNIGFGKGNNEAVKYAKGKILLLLNSDTEVIDDAISKMYKYYTENFTGNEFLGAKLLNSDMTDQPSAAPFYSLPIVFGALFLRGDYWGLTRYSPNKIKNVDWVSGACIMTKKDFFNELGGFDSNIFMYMEEVDLLYRAKEKGYKTTFFPAAKFIHHGAISSGGRSAPILNVYKGFLFFYRKHYSNSEIYILKVMLKLKAMFALYIGKIINNNYLINTYGEALKIVEKY